MIGLAIHELILFLRKVEKSDSRMNHTFRSGQSKRPVLSMNQFIIFTNPSE